jgi:hypothetical protein
MVMNKANLPDLDEEEYGECDEAGAHIGELNGGDVGEESVPDLQESAPRIGHAEQSSQLGGDHLRGGKVYNLIYKGNVTMNLFCSTETSLEGRAGIGLSRMGLKHIRWVRNLLIIL